MRSKTKRDTVVNILVGVIAVVVLCIFFWKVLLDIASFIYWLFLNYGLYILAGIGFGIILLDSILFAVEGFKLVPITNREDSRRLLVLFCSFFTTNLLFTLFVFSKIPCLFYLGVGTLILLVVLYFIFILV